MSVSVTLKSYFYEVLIPSSQKNTSSPIEDILHHVSISFMKKLALYKCFNPRTHTGCDYRNAIENGASEVSIHAPTRGATYRHLRRQRGDPVSIHAPTRGATLLATVSLLEHRHRFNPRTHTGCDAKRIPHLRRLRAGFNPRTHTGCDRIFPQIPHTPHGFNPRTHTGCDTCGRRER